MKKTKCEFCKGKGYVYDYNDDDLENDDLGREDKRPPSIVIPAMLIIAVAIAAFGAYQIYGIDLIIRDNLGVEDLVVGDISVVSMTNDYSNYYIVIANPSSKDLTIESVNIGNRTYVGDFYIRRETTTAIVVPWAFPIDTGRHEVVTVTGRDQDGVRIAKVDYVNA